MLLMKKRRRRRRSHAQTHRNKKTCGQRDRGFEDDRKKSSFIVKILRTMHVVKDLTFSKAPKKLKKKTCYMQSSDSEGNTAVITLQTDLIVFTSL